MFNLDSCGITIQYSLHEYVKRSVYLIRVHIACDLIGNDVRVVVEDGVENRAVIFAWWMKEAMLRNAFTLYLPQGVKSEK